jgi:hypothetical protein
MTIIDRRYSVAEGTAIKAPCRVATTANVTLSGLQTIDGVTLVEHDRVLVRSQTSGAENGIYEASSGNWLRTKDFDGAYDVVSGTLVYICAGSTYAQYEFVVSTTGDIEIGTTAITFAATGAASAAASAAAAAASAATSAGYAADAAASAATAAGFTFTTGDIKFTIKTTADSGWRMFDDGTIGDASSGATYANAAAQALFTLMYNNFVDANAAITTSAGAGTTRAAQTNAATAWANHCRIALPKVLGRALAFAGAGSGLTSRALGVTAGAETQTLVTGNLPPYTPTGTIGTGQVNIYNGTDSVSGPGGAQVVKGGTISGTAGSQSAALTEFSGFSFTGAAQGGTSDAFSIEQPTVHLNAMIKL